MEDKKPEKSELDKIKEQAEEYLNGWKRAKADLINYQKDEQKRFEEFAKFANAALIKDLISVLDSFDLALAVLEKDGKADKGVYMIRGQLEDIMKRNGLERMPESTGNAFDPSLQEAVGEVESDKPAGTVIEEVEKGYRLSGRVIRPARVKISKSKSS